MRWTRCADGDVAVGGRVVVVFVGVLVGNRLSVLPLGPQTLRRQRPRSRNGDRRDGAEADTTASRHTGPLQADGRRAQKVAGDAQRGAFRSPDRCRRLKHLCDGHAGHPLPWSIDNRPTDVTSLRKYPPAEQPIFYLGFPSGRSGLAPPVSGLLVVGNKQPRTNRCSQHTEEGNTRPRVAVWFPQPCGGGTRGRWTMRVGWCGLGLLGLLRLRAGRIR